jgi:hypothetical protein
MLAQWKNYYEGIFLSLTNLPLNLRPFIRPDEYEIRLTALIVVSKFFLTFQLFNRTLGSKISAQALTGVGTMGKTSMKEFFCH